MNQTEAAIAGYDADELQKQYNPGSKVPNRSQVLGRIMAASEEVCVSLCQPRTVRYGEAETATIAAFSCNQDNAPAHIHLHGGGWRYFDARSLGAGMAETYLNAGAHLLLPDFPGADKNGGDLMPIVEVLRQAIVHIHRKAADLGCDPDRLYLSGHSSGAHLASVLATTDWSAYGLDRSPFRAVMCISGMYDLEPVARSGSYPQVTFEDATVERLSAMRHLDRIGCPTIIAVSTIETDEFIRQARDFAAALKAADHDATLIETEWFNHFEIAETLASPYGLLGREMLRVMGLSGP